MNIMKKTVFAIATMFLISCGGSTEPTTTDTLPAVVDSSLTASDTNTAHIPSDPSIK